MTDPVHERIRSQRILLVLVGVVLPLMGVLLWDSPVTYDSMVARLVLSSLAFGSVLFRGGDVYGPVVNVAARLSSLARKGTIRVDHAMATELADAKAFTVSTRTPRPVRGYPQLPSYRLRRSKKR